MNALERFFRLGENGTTVRTEMVAGATTFMTMSYIIFVQPTVLSAAGMDFGAVMVATCLASGLFTILMGLLTNYPIAQAPAMGHNFFFAFTVCGAVTTGGLGYSWQAALGAVFLAGCTYVVLSLVGFREALLNTIPASLKMAIAVGIGLLIALVGFEWAGIVVAAPGTYVTLGNLRSPPVLLALFGTLLTAVLIVRGIRGAILLGILATALVGLPFGLVRYGGLVAAPPPVTPTLFQLEIGKVFTEMGFLTAIFIFFFLDLFDSIGTMVGVAQQAGFLKEGKLPRAREALFSDALATVGGALLGTSTVSSYIESAAGVAMGGRTGLASLFTGLLMFLALFFYPLVRMVGGGLEVGKGVVLYPVIAPALILIGSMMLENVKEVPWKDPTEAIPAFAAIVVMPFTFSITEGIAFGFIAYAALKLATGRGREVHPLTHLFAALFVVRYAFFRV